MDHIHPQLRPAEQAALQRMQAGITAYAAAVEKIIAGIRRGEVNVPWRARQLMEPSKADIRVAGSALAGIGTSVEERVKAAAAGLASLQQRASALMIVFALTVVLIASGFGDTSFSNASGRRFRRNPPPWDRPWGGWRHPENAAACFAKELM